MEKEFLLGLLVASVVATAPASADDYQRSEDTCDTYRELAQRIMTKRQEGRYMPDYFRSLMGRVSDGLILEALNTSIEEGKLKQQMKAVDFSDGVYDRCMDGELFEQYPPKGMS